MIAIGFRASSNEIYYSLVQEQEGIYSIISVSKLNIPVSLKFPEQLNFLRTTVKDIIFEYKARRSGIRITENTAHKTDPVRISFEAILQELLCSSSVDHYFVGQIANISSKIGIKRESFKPILADKKATYENLDLSGYNDKQKESILVAIASLKLK